MSKNTLTPKVAVAVGGVQGLLLAFVISYAAVNHQKAQSLMSEKRYVYGIKVFQNSRNL